MIYFLRDDASRLIKIGFSSNVARRLASIDTDNGNPLSLLGTIPGSRPEEQLLHRQFSYFRVKGEWFRAEPEVIRDIRDLLMREGSPASVWDECDRRGGCRNGLRGVEVSVLDIIDRFKVFTSQWGINRTLLLDLYPADQAGPCWTWNGPVSPDEQRRFDMGIITLSWIADGRLTQEWPIGSMHKVEAKRCVLMTDWPVVCCPPAVSVVGVRGAER